MKPTQEMLNRAMKEAVKRGIFPKVANGETYLHHWDVMEHILEAVMSVQQECRNCITWVTATETAKDDENELPNLDYETQLANPCLDCGGPPAGECIFCEHYSRLIKIEVGDEDTALDFNDEHYVPF